MLSLANLENIQDLVVQMSLLSDMHERRDPSFVQEVKRWLSKLETALRAGNLPESGQVAGLRSTLIATERDSYKKESDIRGYASRRHKTEATAVQTFQQAGTLAINAIQYDRARIGEAERLVRQIISIAKSKNLINGTLVCKATLQDWNELWQTFSTDPAISAGTVNLEGMLGQRDAVILLRRISIEDVPVVDDPASSTSIIPEN